MEDWQLYLETVASRVLGSEAHVAAYVERMRKCSDRPNLFAALDALDAENTAEDVCALRCPTLVAEVDGYTLVDASVAYETDDGRWRFTAYGRNLTDEIYFNGGFADLVDQGYAEVAVARPREYGVTVEYRY